MKRDAYFKELKKFFEDGHALMLKKNTDYADTKDPFRNFRAAEVYDIPVGQAILIRMSDKMSRVATLLKNEAQVKEESVHDTLTDLANYAAILSTYLKYGRKDEK